MKTIFITERPTQIITALAVIDTLRCVDFAEIFIANRFEDASNIAQRLATKFGGVKFTIAESYEAALQMATAKLPTHLFIHWDVGFRTQSKLRDIRRRNTTLKISVFEEGIGTYRQDIYPKAKRIIFKALGLPINIGGSNYIDDIYVYDRARYIEEATRRPKEIIQIRNNLLDTIKQFETELVQAFSSNEFIDLVSRETNELCSIYLSNWDFHESDLQIHFPASGVRIVKLHPHCGASCTKQGILVAPKALPAELLIAIASQLFKNVIVYHFSSSTSLYINSKNVIFIDIKQPQ